MAVHRQGEHFGPATIRDKWGLRWAIVGAAFAIPGSEFMHNLSLVSLLLLSAEGRCKGQCSERGSILGLV